MYILTMKVILHNCTCSRRSPSEMLVMSMQLAFCPFSPGPIKLLFPFWPFTPGSRLLFPFFMVAAK